MPASQAKIIFSTESLEMFVSTATGTTCPLDLAFAA